VSIGASGKFNHIVGFRSAGTVLAVNADPDALVFGAADIGIVAPWRDVIAPLTAALAEVLA
jgi:electron transfer flavoprotein alpha subunit